MDFKNVSKKYRPIPFWSWNEKLDIEETKNQVKLMDEAGIGGFFMHARGGLKTEYMGDEWFSNVSAAVEEAEQRQMRPWAYDENGWPSGFGAGRVNGLGIEYQQKYLRMEDTLSHEDTAICKSGNHYFYYDINPFYVDTLDEKVVAKFIEVAYQPYYEKYGNRVEGFFTDEPQISRKGIPWSFIFEDEYKKRYDENILEHLEELFLPVNDYKNTRVKFWKMVTDLFSENFVKQVYDWCHAHNMKYTGHMVCEENFLSQLTSNGACMPHYEYLDIPGMDWLGRNIGDCVITMQLSSVAEQIGKEAVLSETFALCGHNVSFAELKGIYEWQMVHGINLLCQHLEGYSNRGIRKRDFPPAMYIQQPWWDEYNRFNDAMSRIGMILTNTEKHPDVLVLHPQTTAWTLYDGDKCDGIHEYFENFLNQLKVLEQKHIQYHLGDETIIERHAEVKNGKFIIGKQSYSYIVDPGCEILLDSTKALLDEFVKQGGKIISVDDLAENPVCSNADITYAKRCGNGINVHYFVNTSSETKESDIFVNGKSLNIETGNLEAFTGKHSFEPWGSLLLIDDGEECREKDLISETEIRLPQTLNIIEPVENAMTLDCCDYYFDGKLQEKNGYVLNIAERANALERPVKIHQDYYVSADFIPEKLYLVCETPEIFKIFVNGTEIEKNIAGYFRDKSFKKIEIAKYMVKGENVISFECDFTQSDEFYENYKKAFKFESELNKLVYDMEIEAIYLVGDFTVSTAGEWKQLERRAMRYNGDFVIDAPKDIIKTENIQMQGFTFLSGTIYTECEIDIQGENPVLVLNRKGFNVVKVEINGIEKVMLWTDRLPLADFGVSGKTKVKLTLVNNLRNLLGPHHLEEGEAYAVSPSRFFKEKCVWNSSGWGRGQAWNDDYCFVQLGI